MEQKTLGRTFCMGDLHGGFKALEQCLQRSNFDMEQDTLIQLGDVVDGWDEVYQCVELLCKVKNLILIKGNHDQWFYEWLMFKSHPCRWLQGGNGTLSSYANFLKRDVWTQGDSGWTTNLIPSDIPEHHKKFFDLQRLYYIDNKNRCFVHGGFKRTEYVDYLKVVQPQEFYWNRDLWKQALSCKGDQRLNTANGFKEIFIGHTHVDDWRNPNCLPMESGGVMNLDTGAGFAGKLTIMEVETHEYWQSDMVQTLYPNQEGRNYKYKKK